MARMRKPIVDEKLCSWHRIPFGPEIIEELPCGKDDKGRYRHRRHIISQHLLRGAWNKMAGTIATQGEGWLRAMAEKVASNMDRLPDPSKALLPDYRCRIYASEILRGMNDNRNNLFVENGGENSGIGSFTHNAYDLVQKIEAAAKGDFDAALKLALETLNSQSGSWGQEAKEHYASIKSIVTPVIESVESYDELAELLNDLVFSTDLDLDKTGSKAPSGTWMTLHAGFLAFSEEAETSLLKFQELILKFMSNAQ